MNKILELDPENLYVRVQAGTPTLEIQNAAKAHGLLYAGDPCSTDAGCEIGGNISTNAGGNKASVSARRGIRYIRSGALQPREKSWM